MLIKFLIGEKILGFEFDDQSIFFLCIVDWKCHARIGKGNALKLFDIFDWIWFEYDDQSVPGIKKLYELGGGFLYWKCHPNREIFRSDK